MNAMIIQTKITKNKEATKPFTKKHTGAIQILSATRLQIPGHSQKEIDTGIEIKVPEGYYGLLIDADETIGNYSFHVRAQVVTNRELKLSVFNYSPYPELVVKGQTIAQIIILPMQEVHIKKVANIE